MEFFMLQHIKTGKLMGLHISYNGDDSEFCNENSVELIPYSEGVLYMSTSKEEAELVSNNSTPWYNSSSIAPTNNYIGELRVVKFNTEV